MMLGARTEDGLAMLAYWLLRVVLAAVRLRARAKESPAVLSRSRHAQGRPPADVAWIG
jgi:hypothetical protein